MYAFCWDDDDLRSELTALLRHEGFEIAVATDGHEALALLNSAALRDVILLDLMMPRMNGWEFRERQLADDRLRDIPLVVMSAGANRTLSAVQPLGADAVLRKPLALDALIGTLKQKGTTEDPR